MDLYIPNSAINMEVFPEPVGPTIRLIQSCLKMSSSSIRSTNLRFDGVSEPSTSFDHAKVASRKPMASSLDWASLVNSCIEFSSSENESSSSVYQFVNIQQCTVSPQNVHFAKSHSLDQEILSLSQIARRNRIACVAGPEVYQKLTWNWTPWMHSNLVSWWPSVEKLWIQTNWKKTKRSLTLYRDQFSIWTGKERKPCLLGRICRNHCCDRDQKATTADK